MTRFDGEIRLALDEADQFWRGRATDLDRHGTGAGPCGPAGVVLVASGDVSATACVLSGRIESLEIPARELDPGESGLLTLLCGSSTTDFDGGDKMSGASERSVEVRPAAQRWDLHRLALLENDEREVDQLEWLPEAVLAIEHAIVCSEVAESAPDLDLVADLDHLASRAKARVLTVGNRASTDTSPPLDVSTGLRLALDGILKDVAERSDKLDGRPSPRLKDLVVEMDRVRHEEQQRLRRVAIAEARASYGAANGQRMHDSRGPSGSASRAHASSFAEPAPPGSRPAAAPQWRPIGANDVLDVDQALAAQFELQPGRERLLLPDARAGWGTLRLTAATTAPRSRWLVLYDDLGALVGAAPLVPSVADARSLAAQVAVDGRPVSAAVSAHPIKPSTNDRLPSPAVAADLARAADRSELAEPEALWIESALEWLRIGAVYRAAWAWNLADRPSGDRWSHAFDDPETAVSAVAVLSAVVATGSIPSPEEHLLRPRWPLVGAGRPAR